MTPLTIEHFFNSPKELEIYFVLLETDSPMSLLQIKKEDFDKYFYKGKNSNIPIVIKRKDVKLLLKKGNYKKFYDESE